MICTNCRAEWSLPLVTHDGKWYCPKCKHDVFPNENTVFVINSENHTLLTLSEIKFKREYLTGTGVRVNALDIDERRAALGEAIELCRQSASLNNPYALLLLGYYYENGYITEDSVSQSELVIAATYYLALFKNKQSIKVEFDTRQTHEQMKAEIRLNAAIGYVGIMSRLGKVKSVGEDIKEYLRSHGESMDKLMANAMEKQSAVAASNDSVMISFAETVTSMNGDGATPYLGVYRLSANDNWEPFFGSDAVDVLQRLLADKKLTFGIKTIEDSSFKRDKKVNILANLRKRLEERKASAKNYSVYFFFLHEDPVFSYNIKPREIKKLLEAQNYGLIADIFANMESRKMNSLVLTLDDFYIHLDKKDYNKAIAKVIESFGTGD